MRSLWRFLRANRTLILSIGFLTIFSFGVARATPPASPYSAGATLDPQCTPGSSNCTVSVATTYTFGTGLTNSSGTITVNASQSISTLSNLTSNGLVKTSGGTGALSIATADTDYTTPSGTETFTNKTFDTAGAGNVLKVNGTQISGVTGTGNVVLATSPTISGTTLQGGVTTSGDITLPAWGAGTTGGVTTGPNITVAHATYTDNSTAASGNVNYSGINVLNGGTIAATNTGVTYTNTATLFIASAPTAGTNVTITGGSYGLYIPAGVNAFLGNFTGGGSNSNAWFPTTSNAGASTNGAQYLFAGAANVNFRVSLGGGNSSNTLPANNSYGGTIFASAPITTAASGTHAMLATVVVNPLGTVTAGGAAITNTADLYVGAASAAGTNNYSIYSAGGNVNFQSLSAGGLVKSTAGTLAIATAGTDYQAPLTFSTGLTNTSNTITNNLSTGVAGGQSVVGGTAAGNTLTLSSTSNATKGKILFGTSAYDESQNFLGLGTNAPTGMLELGGDISAPAWGTVGINFNINSQTFTDTTTTGSTFNNFVNTILPPTLAATNTGVTYTGAASLLINGAPNPGTNVTITNPAALWVSTGSTGTGIIINGNFTNGTTRNSALFSANQAISFTPSTSPTLVQAAVDGVMYYGGSVGLSGGSVYANNWDLRLNGSGTFSNNGNYNPDVAGIHVLARTVGGFTGTINGELVGGDFQVNDSAGAGTLTTIAGIEVGSPGYTAGGTVSGSVYGLRIANQGNAAWATSYGIRVDAQSGSTANNYAIYVGGGNVNVQGLTASQAVFTDASKNLISVATTGSGNVVLATSPTLVTPNIGAATGTGLALTSANTTQTTTSAALSLVGNSLTTGTGMYLASSSLTSGYLADLEISGTAAAASQTGLNILTTGASATSGITTYGAQISNTHTNATSGTNVALYLNASGATTANYGLIVNAGNVGIGTTSPAYPLVVSGNTYITGQIGVGTTPDTSSVPNFQMRVIAADDVAEFQTTSVATTATNGRAFAVGVSTETFNRSVFYSNGTIGIGAGTATRDTFLSRASAGVFEISGAFDNSTNGSLYVTGNIGIGLSPNAPLDISSTATTTNVAQIAANSLTTGNALSVSSSATGNTNLVSFVSGGTGANTTLLKMQYNGLATLATTNQFVQFLNSTSTQQGAITGTGTTGQVVYTTTSDQRLKHNIQPTALSLNDLMKISVDDYVFNGDPNSTIVTGFIAQQLQPIFPEAVSATDNGTDALAPGAIPWGVDYGRITPLLVKSIQDQQKLLGSFTTKDTPNSTLIADIEKEDPHDPVAIVQSDLQANTSVLTDFLAARVSAIRGYFNEIFAKKVHSNQICLTKSDGSEICVNGDQLQNIVSGNGGGSTTAVVVPPPTATPSPDTSTPTTTAITIPDPTTTPAASTQSPATN